MSSSIAASTLHADMGAGKLISTVKEKDSSPDTTYNITTGTPSVNEDAGTITFTISRSASASAETLYVSTTPNEGFANSGDYQGLLNLQINFAAGQTTQTVTIKVNDDLISEIDERFGIIVQRNAADDAGTFLARTTFTIHDNDVSRAHVLLGTYPAAGIDSIGQGNRDSDDSHTPGTARQWSYDFLTPNQTDVHAVEGGTVVAVRQDLTGAFRGYGNVVTVRCDSGVYVTYAHLTAFSCTVTAGMRITAGQIIAKSGDSGSYDGTSLHPNLHIQFGSAASLLNAIFGNSGTATLIADGSGDSEAPAYFPKLTIHFDSRSDPGLSTDTDYYGTRGIDDFFGNSVGNKVEGLAGNDILRGMGGKDQLLGGVGNDILDGGTGADSMSGGKGDDIFAVDNIGDVVAEALGAGTDTVMSSITWTLAANIENLMLTGSSNVSGYGNALGNAISGNSGANLLSGEDGNDRLNGGDDGDTINGGNGDDLLIGAAGRDMLAGGSGSDTFAFLSITDSSANKDFADVITDFAIGIDKLDVSAIDAMASVAGLDHFKFIGTSTITAGGQVSAIQSGNDTILFFNTGGTLAPETTIKLIGVTASSLTVLDFIL